MAATNATTRTARVKFNGDASDLKRAARTAERAMEGVSGKSKIVSGALSSIGSTAVSLGPKLAAAFAAAPAIAAAAATGIVLAFGTAISGIGIAVAAQNKKVRRDFRSLKRDVLGDLKKMARPFQDTLHSIADTARETWKVFRGPLRKAMKEAAPVVSGFVDQFGEGLEKLAPAIEPLTDAFKAIIRQLGPVMPRVMKKISDAMREVAKVVEDNAAEFGIFFEAILEAIPKTIELIAKLAEGFGAFIRNVGPWAADFLGAYRKMLKGVKAWVDFVLDAFGKVLDAAEATFGKLPGPIGDAVREANDNFDRFRKGIDNTFDRANDTLRGWERSLNRLPKQIRLRGEISDLKSKIREARQRLRTVPKHRRSEIRGRIRDLRRKVREAKRAIDGIPDYKTVTIDADVTADYAAISGRGRIPRRAHGGPVRAGRTYLVGEQGPELVTMGSNGNVTPNHQLGGGGVEVRVFLGDRELTDIVRTEVSEHDRGLKRRALAGTGAAR